MRQRLAPVETDEIGRLRLAPPRLAVQTRDVAPQARDGVAKRLIAGDRRRAAAGRSLGGAGPQPVDFALQFGPFGALGAQRPFRDRMRGG